MRQSVEFWFDFVSPYAYIAAQSIEQLAAQYERDVEWKPMLLGAVFKTTGSSPLTMRPPIMADYFQHDFVRSARYAGVPFVMPEVFPIATQNTARVCLWMQETTPQQVGEFVRSVTRAYFSGPAAINDPHWLGEHVSRMGLDGSAAAAACENPHYKDALKAQCEQAIANGIFGAPWIRLDGESFWGNARLPQVEKWLANGGF